MISTKGRYAVRILLDLAEHRDAGYIPMKEVVKRQGMSLKYVERILPALRDAGLISGLHGKGGGYRLTREPEQYTLFEILRCAEGDLASVACLQENAAPCARAASRPSASSRCSTPASVPRCSSRAFSLAST